MAGADKVVLLSHFIESKYLKLAREKGKPTSGYSRFIDLRKTPEELPVLLYCGGIHNGIHKLQFVDVGHLGLSRTRKIAKTIFGDLRSVRIFRIDWCIDLWGYSALDVARYCRLARVQNCSVICSRSGITFYLRDSKEHVLLIYDRLDRLRSIRHPLAECCSSDDQVTRVEVQLRGRGLPFRRLRDIERYAEVDLLSGMSFWELPRKKENLSTTDALAAEGLLSQIERFGLQVASKMYTAQTWAYLSKKYLIPASELKFPNLEKLMRKGVRDWLEDRLRFPRLGKKVAS